MRGSVWASRSPTAHYSPLSRRVIPKIYVHTSDMVLHVVCLRTGIIRLSLCVMLVSYLVHLLTFLVPNVAPPDVAQRSEKCYITRTTIGGVFCVLGLSGRRNMPHLQLFFLHSVKLLQLHTFHFTGTVLWEGHVGRPRRMMVGCLCLRPSLLSRASSYNFDRERDNHIHK